jgi:DNA polymerase-3 subunit gamma/tau
VSAGSPPTESPLVKAAVNAAPTTGIAAARAALANARNGSGRQEGGKAAGRQEGGKTAGRPEAAKAGGRPEAVGTDAARPDSWSDGTAAAEPPYDPEYDGPPRSKAAGFEGFDPGDEPLDLVIDEKTARQSSEQQAMQLLQDAFGAEKIGES